MRGELVDPSGAETWIFLERLASCQIRKIAGCACAGIPGTFSPPPRVSDPDRHHGTCLTHVPWCMPGSLTTDFLWSWWRGKLSRHSRRMRNPQFHVSGKRPMGLYRDYPWPLHHQYISSQFWLCRINGSCHLREMIPTTNAIAVLRNGRQCK